MRYCRLSWPRWMKPLSSWPWRMTSCRKITKRWDRSILRTYNAWKCWRTTTALVLKKWPRSTTHSISTLRLHSRNYWPRRPTTTLRTPWSRNWRERWISSKISCFCSTTNWPRSKNWKKEWLGLRASWTRSKSSRKRLSSVASLGSASAATRKNKKPIEWSERWAKRSWLKTEEDYSARTKARS